ncbi:hypothetical protein EH228_10535 [Erwinia endophytica]|uniref:hypothetical protein n=1 Tax=Erwinia endophytica TaxID=1563158 RepID=UPI001265EA82|nr:hypothetical protein [Erwinia endophytica]KAB8310541.1 hypothetical protein EH228_10535 [Erwinia endophytica]
MMIIYDLELLSFNVLQNRSDIHWGDFDYIPNKILEIVVSSHPIVIDGLVLINMVSRVRKNIKFFAHYVLKVMFPQVCEMPISIKNMQGNMGHRQLKIAASDTLWNGIFSVIRRYPDVKYFSGALSIPGVFSCEAKELILIYQEMNGIFTR